MHLLLCPPGGGAMAAGASAEPAGFRPQVSKAAQFPQQVHCHHGADPLHFGLLTISSLRHQRLPMGLPAKNRSRIPQPLLHFCHSFVLKFTSSRCPDFVEVLDVAVLFNIKSFPFFEQRSCCTACCTGYKAPWNTFGNCRDSNVLNKREFLTSFQRHYL